MKSSLLHASPDVPDDDLLLVLLIGQNGTEGHHVALAGREVNQLHPRVAEPHDLLKFFPSPQGYTLGMESGQVSTLR